MEKMIKQEDYLNNLFSLLDETFDNTHGHYLDRDTSLFRTLETVSSAEASIAVGGRCASLAAQVAHVTFYMEVLERVAIHHDTTPVDWGEIWRTVERATPDEWESTRSKLKETYQRLNKLFHENEIWNEDTIGGTMAILVHSAYHLGEIRQALCTIKK